MSEKIKGNGNGEKGARGGGTRDLPGADSENGPPSEPPPTIGSWV